MEKEPVYISTDFSAENHILKVENLPEVNCVDSCEFDLNKTLELSGLKEYSYKFYEGEIPCLNGKLIYRTQKEIENVKDK